MKTDTLIDFYKVTETDQPVTLTVNIGYDMKAVTKLTLNNQEVAGPESDGCFVRSFEKILGTNNVLNGKKLLMTTLILDTVENVAKTSLLIKLTGGVAQYAQKLETKPTAKGGVVRYSIGIHFRK